MKRLALFFNTRRIISGAFNFKAYRLMYDLLSDTGVTPPALDAAALVGVIVLFDGTELTEDILRGGGVNAAELSRAMDRVIDWYMDVKPQLGGGAVIGTPPEKPILALYRSLLEHHLPDDIDRQDPQLLIDVMAAKDGDMTRTEDIPEEYRMFYGL